MDKFIPYTEVIKKSNNKLTYYEKICNHGPCDKRAVQLYLTTDKYDPGLQIFGYCDISSHCEMIAKDLSDAERAELSKEEIKLIRITFG